MYTTIISTGDLAAHLNDYGWVLIDCRFDLKDPEWGYNDYRDYHIPRAVYAHLDKDLAGPVTPETGRHPLPNPHEMTERLSSWGIGDDTQVVVYDTSGGAFAARLWFQLRLLGHQAAAVLDGGFQKWRSEGRPLRSGIETNARKVFHPQINLSQVVDTAFVEQIRQHPGYRLIDARAPERYRGETEPIDPVAGHIPGAVNRFHGSNLTPEGAFLPPEVLRQQFQALIGGTDPGSVVAYCGSGVTSCHHILAMEIAGLPGARLYPGSWSEWIRDPNRPVK